MTRPQEPAGRETVNLEQFAASRWLETRAHVQGHIHAGLRSAPTTKTYRRWYERELRRLIAASQETERAYAEAIASGEIVGPDMSRVAQLERTAAGHPDNPSTQAARRLLAGMTSTASTP